MLVGNSTLVFPPSGLSPEPPPPHDGNDMTQMWMFSAVFTTDAHLSFAVGTLDAFVFPCAGFMTVLVCQETSAVLHCPEESVINIQSAFYGRKSGDICPHLGNSDGRAACAQKNNSK